MICNEEEEDECRRFWMRLKISAPSGKRKQIHCCVAMLFNTKNIKVVLFKVLF